MKQTSTSVVRFILSLEKKRTNNPKRVLIEIVLRNWPIIQFLPFWLILRLTYLHQKKE